MGKTRTLIDHVNIQGWMLRNLALTTKNEVVVYATIFSFSRDGVSEYRGGRSYLAQSLNIPITTLDKVLNKLIDAKLILKENYVIHGVTLCNYKADLNKIRQFLPKDEFNEEEWCTQNDNTPTQNDNTPTQNDKQVNKNIIKDINKVNGKPFTPAKLDNSIKHPRNFSKNTLTDELNSLGELEEKELQKKEKQKAKRKKTLYEKCIDEIANPIYGFSTDVQQRLKDFLPTTLQANEYSVKGINQWIYRLKSLVAISTDSNKQIEIIEYSISHSITGFINSDKYKKKSSNNYECSTESIHSTPIEEARNAMEEKKKKGVPTF